MLGLFDTQVSALTELVTVRAEQSPTALAV